ncbi:Polyketide synthase modules and related proteins [uncultured Microcoleus sp.]|uniref:Polyketide synthase modules and related proteins n=1 Tax=uncultured Microcoleus sp. TaxID=259945 RepID=A0A6J4NRE7_9CYAN|nr:Polyketide synthase modules and related proteins [uncultured Microcoleus sp.]
MPVLDNDATSQFKPNSGERIYKTGDLVRYRADRNLETSQLNVPGCYVENRT